MDAQTMDRPGGTEGQRSQSQLIRVFVNEQSVNLLGHRVTGRQIKTAAIEQGVSIKLNFVLEEDLKDGERRVVHDHEHVELSKGLRFIAREDEHDVVTVTVNEQPVKLRGHRATGAEIKAAAIAQGVAIQPNFVLEEELKDGERRVVHDHEHVELNKDLRFIAREGEHDVVTVTVNEQPVKLRGHRATGAEIKAAAIAQGVAIQPNFVLQEELPNGTSRVVGDRDHVHLREHLRFTAIAPDDNS